MKRIVFIVMLVSLACTVTDSNRTVASSLSAPTLVDQIVTLVDEARQLCDKMQQMIVMHELGVTETIRLPSDTTFTISGTASAAAKITLRAEFMAAADSVSAKVLRAKALIP